jgi:hypothetical protein
MQRQIIRRSKSRNRGNELSRSHLLVNFRNPDHRLQLAAGVVDACSAIPFGNLSAFALEFYSEAGNRGSLRTGDTLSARTRSKMPGAISGSRS